MKIGLLLPSVLMYEKWSEEKIFAPKLLFRKLADGLVKLNHDVTVFASSDTQTSARLIPGDDELALKEPPQMKIRYLTKVDMQIYARRDSRWEYEIDLTARAYDYAKQNGIEILHSFLDFTAHYFSQFTGIPTVYTLHDPAPDAGTLDYWRLRRFPQDTYIAISNSQKFNLESLVNIAATVYNGIDPVDYPIVNKPANDCLFVGRYMPEKGVTDAIDASISAGVSLHLASSKEYKKVKYYKDEIVPRLINPLISEVGFMDFNQKVRMLGQTKVLLFPIKWDEPFGIVMIEAMACGTPVIAYNRGSVSEIVRDGVTGFIVNDEIGDLGDLGDLKIKKRGVAGLVEAIRRIGEIDRAACRRHVEENFTVEKMVSGYEAVYRKVVEK